MPPPKQERFNAKARGSVAGGSHKKRKRPRQTQLIDEEEAEHGVSQSPLVLESVQGIGEAETLGRGKMSAKKRKRMESYVAKKLKNEERAETLNLIASLAPDTTTSAHLASSRSLGQNPLAPSSAQERVEEREDRLVRRGMERMSKRNGELRYDSEASDDDGGEGSEERRMLPKSKASVSNSAEGVPTLEAGIKQKPKKNSKKASWNPGLLVTQPKSEDSSDFDSSASSDENGNDESASRNGENEIIVDVPVPVGEAAVEVLTVNGGKPAPMEEPNGGARSFGGALKKTSDGAVMAPRVVPRRQKMPRGRNLLNREDVSSDEGSSSSLASASDEDVSGVTDESEDRDVGVESDVTSDGLEEGSEERNAGDKPKRSLGFKDWALGQMGRKTVTETPEMTQKKPEPPPFATKSPTVQPPATRYGPLGAQLQIPESSLLDESKGPSSRPDIKRRDSASKARMDLPILAEEQAIVEAVRMNPVVIVAGETGSGKTTQVPQMLYEAGFGYKPSAVDHPGMIAITQPRRVAAVSLSARVKEELNLPLSSGLVAHQIRYSSTTSPETCIKFMTDGVLLRELSTDFLLSKYSVVIVDEAHERGINTDVLIGVLSRVAKLREKKWRESLDKQPVAAASQFILNALKIRPLRIVIMSATLRIEDFTSNPSLFPKPPPIIHIPARQHPVTIHFARKTVSDYVEEAYKKVCRIHSRLPQGGVLVFLTGQVEIQSLCRKLERRYGAKQAKSKSYRGHKQSEGDGDAQMELKDSVNEIEDVELGQDEDLAADVDDGEAQSDPEALDSDEDVPDISLEEDANEAPLHILPLYSLLAHDQQMRVFSPPPPGHRLVIVATNVAETSLTIPGIRYVVDSGRSKERHYDPISGVQSFQVSWISKASASQRSGRAGRTGPGHVYRLYSSALYEDHFEAYTKPEILRMPIEGVVLQMKSMNIDSVVNFPFPTAPDRLALTKAQELLTQLEALSRPTNTKMIAGVQHAGKDGGSITDLGRAMAGYPVSPRFAKMLVIGNQHDCLAYVLAIVAGLSVGDPFIHEQSLRLEDEAEWQDDDPELEHLRNQSLREKEEKKRLRGRYFKAHSQFESLGGGKSDLFKLLAAIGAYEYDPTPTFCANNFLRPKAMQEIQQLRRQISNIAGVPLTLLSPPSETQLKVIRQIILSSSLDRVAVRMDVALKHPSSFSSSRHVPYRALGLSSSEEAFIHPSSVHFHRPPPEFLTFQEITRTDLGKVYLKGVTAIHPSWLTTLGKGMCTWSKPSEVGVRGRGKVDQVREGEREVVVVPHFASLGVDLPPKQMKQRREGTRWVLVE